MRQPQEYLLRLQSAPTAADIDAIYTNVFRTTFVLPGFMVLDFGRACTPAQLRASMIALKDGLQARLHAHTGATLHCQWLGRFDQQETTKFHRDNAPAQSFLMLGYEPTTVRSRLFLADFLRYARDHNITEADYLAHHNPMFVEGELALAPYTTEVQGFDAQSYRIVLMNNSDSSRDGGTLGLLHKAEMVTPDPSATRIVNSMMLAIPQPGDVELVTATDVQAFLRGE